ncbi:MAG: HNH endonuclease [Sulfobacillus sp.]
MNQAEIDSELSAIVKSFDAPLLSERTAEYHRSDYRAYLESPQWKQLRSEALRRAKYLCQICASPQKLQVHHRKYPRFLGTEPVEDLTVLCHRCHRQWHGEK